MKPVYQARQYAINQGLRSQSHSIYFRPVKMGIFQKQIKVSRKQL